MQEEIRLLLRELVLQGGGDPNIVAPAEPPWTRANDTARAAEPTVDPPLIEEEIE